MPGSCHLCKKADAKACCGGCKSVFYCDRECQIKHWNEHKLECQKKLKCESKDDEKKTEMILDMNNFTFTLPIFDDTSINIKHTVDYYGYGMFTNNEIKKGRIIYAEKAMIVLPDYAKQKMTFYIKEQFILLSETQKNIYKSLSREKDMTNDNDILLNIFVNNQIVIKERKSCCIFPLLSRINHSCIGNAHWIWNEKENEERLIAITDINKNDEILVNYCGNEPIEYLKRKMELKTKWNIKCKCNWCLNNKICLKIDEIINEYNMLNKSLESLMSNPLNGYKTSQKLIKIIQKYFNSNPNLMYKHCYDSAQFALGLQKWNEASYYLEQSLKEKQIAKGNDIKIDDLFMEKVHLLPTKFRSRFRKYDPKYIKMRMLKNNKLNKNNNHDIKQNGQKNKSVIMKTKHSKKISSNGKSNSKSNAKKKSNNRNNKSKNKGKKKTKK